MQPEKSLQAHLDEEKRLNDCALQIALFRQCAYNCQSNYRKLKLDIRWVHIICFDAKIKGLIKELKVTKVVSESRGFSYEKAGVVSTSISR